MNGLASTAIIIGVFFAAGIALGITAIISLSALGRRRRNRAWPRSGDPDVCPPRVVSEARRNEATAVPVPRAGGEWGDP